MEFLVCILYSKKFDKTYVGFTTSLIERFYSHNKYQTKGYTTKFRPWIVIHIEIFKSKSEAMAKEKWFKSGVGRESIKKILSELNIR